MTAVQDNAFPISGPPYAPESRAGLTKREYIATAILQGMCGLYPLDPNSVTAKAQMKTWAKDAVDLADFLIKELKK